MPQLTCQRVQFYSAADEAAFFRFAQNIDGVSAVRGAGDSIILEVTASLSDEALRDLIALFERYRISGAGQLAQFASDSNRIWFADPKQFWYKRVFDRASAI